MVAVLHAVLSFAALLRFRERLDRGSALVLGVLLGGSIYSYQLSWFVPLLAGAALVAQPSWCRRPNAVQGTLLVAAIAATTALPGVTIGRKGLDAVSEQTFDTRALWKSSAAGTHPPWAESWFLAPRSTTQAELERRAATFEASGLWVFRRMAPSGRAVLAVAGEPGATESAREELVRTSWLEFHPFPGGAWARLTAILSELFVSPAFEDGRVIDVPLLHPLLSPLVILGLVHMALRWREPFVRCLLIWMVAGGLLPTVLGGPMPRRTLLLQPWIYAVAGLPLEAILDRRTASGEPPRWRVRIARATVAVSLIAALVATNAYMYFHRWSGYDARRPSVLFLTKLIHRAARDESIVISLRRDHASPWLPRYLTLVEGERVANPRRGQAGRLWILPWRRPTLTEVLDLACQLPKPFTWIASDTPDYREPLESLGAEFRHVAETRGAYRVYRILSIADGACPQDGVAGRG
jgi:hypothetical protein